MRAASKPARRARRLRGFTLLELIVSVTVLAFVTMLLYGAFSGMKHTRDGLTRVQDRYREGRTALARIVRDLESAYISQQLPINQSLAVLKTAFIAKQSTPADRIDFNTFTNIRRDRNSHVSDQLEVSYFSEESLETSGTVDLVRRSSQKLDLYPDKGGRIDVVATDIDLFDLAFLDPTTSQWVDTWDTTSATGQQNRMPLQVRVTLVINGGRRSSAGRMRQNLRFETTVPIQIINPLTFAIQGGPT
jgi:general secretion pathway protein J